MENVELTRDTSAVRIPAGDKVTLEEGTEVYIQQSLGGSWTVQAPRYGGLFRISGVDADALGREVPEDTRRIRDADGSIEDRVELALRTCYDPEIPVNIVDLGLVYDTRIEAAGEGTHHVDVKMTLTAVGCGMGASIAADAEDKILSLADVEDARVEIVWDPPWSPQMISEEGRKKLGLGD